MPTNTYTPLETITLSGGETSVVFSSIPSDYRDLVISYELFGNNIAPYLRLNNDTATGAYNGLWMRGYSSGIQAVSYSSLSYWRIFTSTASTTLSNHGVLQLMDYSATNKYKAALLRQDITDSHTNAHAWIWDNNSAVNRIDIILFADSFSSGSTISLYGIAS